jgi:protein-tyrosine phosphatase
MPYRLLFVCLGNICRSPSAENIMRHLVEQAGLGDQIQCDSAGTSSYHVGSPPDRRMAASAKQQGIILQGQARQFERIDFESFDLILAMDRDNYAGIAALDPTAKHAHKVRLMCDFCTRHTLREVPDPYYGGADGFNQVIELLMDACEGLLDYVVREAGLNKK